jgi:molybdate transport system ATP-binding protein
MSVLAQLSLSRQGFSLNVTLDLPGRGISALFGPSGSGKTSLLRCLAGLEPDVQGSIVVDGEQWQGQGQGQGQGQSQKPAKGRAVFMPPHQRRVGYVFQEASLLPHLNVQGNLDYGWRRTAAAERRIGMEQAIALLGLKQLLTRRPQQLSGGERQRVAIARTLLTSPKLLLMDEPLSNLDQAGKQEIVPYLKRLHAALPIPVLYVSHALDEVIQLADTLILLAEGKVTATGPITQLLTRIDLPLAHADDACALIDASVSGFDPQFHLTHLDCALGPVCVLQPHMPDGQRVRVRISAKDVSIALHAPHDSSILNRFPMQICAINADRPGQVIISLTANGTELLARITAKSADALGLAIGMQVVAQVKSVALVL